MSVAGYVLAGGNSTRMGTDKALLHIGGVALAKRIAQAVEQAAGSVTLIGDPARYRALGLAVTPDLRPGCGPLAGMEAALTHSTSEWNLIVACDLAAIRADFLRGLCARAVNLESGADCLLPAGPDSRLQPLCAAYRRRCLEPFSAALDRGARKVTDVVGSLRVSLYQTTESELFQNVNTPEEWNRYANGRIN
jgi:molybdopterin-guanine dinucleotide biosynthesis protein A